MNERKSYGKGKKVIWEKDGPRRNDWKTKEKIGGRKSRNWTIKGREEKCINNLS